MKKVVLASTEKGGIALAAKDVKDPKSKLKAIEDSLATKTAEVAELKEKLSTAQAELKGMGITAEALRKQITMTKIAEKGYTFKIVTDKGSKTYDNLAKAIGTSQRKEGPVMFAVKDKKEQKIMIWTDRNPLTNRKAKGFSWFFVSETAFKRFGTPVEKKAAPGR